MKSGLEEPLSAIRSLTHKTGKEIQGQPDGMGGGG